MAIKAIHRLTHDDIPDLSQTLDKAPHDDATPILERDNIGRLVKGNPRGNPFGPEHKSITAYLRHYLAKHPGKVERLTHTLVELGIKGNMMALTTILERIDGKVTDHVQMDVRPIALEFVPAETMLLTTTTTIVDQPSQLQIQSSTQGTEDKDPG
jgi:hypothetical protein